MSKGLFLELLNPLLLFLLIPGVLGKHLAKTLTSDALKYLVVTSILVSLLPLAFDEVLTLLKSLLLALLPDCNLDAKVIFFLLCHEL